MEHIAQKDINNQSEIITRLRFPLILLVVYLHSYGLPSPNSQLPLLQSGIYEVTRTILSGMIAHSAVPAFFFISGFLMFYGVENFKLQTYLSKMRKRTVTLLPPYVIWNMIALMVWFVRQINMGSEFENLLSHYMEKGLLSCFWIFYVVGDANKDLFGDVTHLTTPANLPLWYLRDLIVVSLFSPFVYYCVGQGRVRTLLLLAFIFLSGLFQNLPGLSSVAVFFYCFGAYFSITKTDFSKIFRCFFKPILVLYALLLIYIIYNDVSGPAMMLFPLFRMVGVFVIFGLGEWATRHSLPSFPKIFTDSSFFVFAVHYVFFMSIIDQLVGYVFPSGNEFTHTLQYLVSPVLKVAVYAVVYYVLKRIAPCLISVLVGKR